jgi:hypothetical protein
MCFDTHSEEQNCLGLFPEVSKDLLQPLQSLEICPLGLEFPHHLLWFALFDFSISTWHFSQNI